MTYRVELWSCRKGKDGESLREQREGTDAANVAWSIKVMELLVCSLEFLSLTSTSADHSLPQNTRTHPHKDTGVHTHAPCRNVQTCIHIQGCVQPEARGQKNEMGHVRLELSRRPQGEKRKCEKKTRSGYS